MKNIIIKLKNQRRIRRHLHSGKDLCLEIGCGPTPKQGFINCDARDLPTVDIVCMAWDIPFPKGSISKIASRHMIEHVTRDQAIQTLQHWYELLKSGGELDVNTPDLNKTVEQLSMSGKSQYVNQDVTNKEHALYSLYGWQTNPYDFHKWLYDFESLYTILKTIGFQYIDRVEDTESISGPLNLRIIAKK